MRHQHTAFALFRLPEQADYTLVAQATGTPKAVASVSALDNEEGFVIAPFESNADHPILLLRPDVVEVCAVGVCEPVAGDVAMMPERAAERACYHEDFVRFHAQLASGRYGKLVLSRRSRVSMTDAVQAEQLFLKACRMYPHQFIALVSTEQSGTWLMATPELLLKGSGSCWQTMSLAGTLRAPEVGDDYRDTVWSEKNLAEQRYVSAYISDILHRYSDRITMTGPYTTKAAHLLHLRTDFKFKMPTSRMGDLLTALHPTPAVCGIPKEEACRFILQNETTDRKYYSGFCGMLRPRGETQLYVSLRCMEVSPDACTLYAGGGLLAESVEQNEWMETQNKLLTMYRLLRS